MNYDNQAQVDKIIKEIREMFPTEPLSVTSRNNVALMVSVEIPIKGNKKIINELEAMGFRKGRKRMPPRSNYWDLHEQREFVIEMQKAVRETTLELEDL